MAAWTQQSDDDPFFRVQGHPIYVTELLVGIYSVLFILTALSQYLGIQVFLANLALSTGAVATQGKVWQLLTYPLINPLDVWFAVEMLMLYWFGREVERALGRKGFLALYLSLIAVPALLLVGLSLGFHQEMVYNGSSDLHFAVFIAFAILFPDAPIFFGILTKWVALALIGLYTLLGIAHHQWSHLAILWAGIAVAAVAIRVPFVSGFFEWLEERRERERVLRVQQKIAEKKAVEERRNQSIDPILEKISREGMQSLTREERDRLERARLDLLQRDQRK